MLKEEYDVIVVGAGPAGSTAARYAAEGGARVLLLEKDRDVGYPVHCAEAVSDEGVSQFIKPDPKWIATTVTNFRLVAPNGEEVVPRLDGPGYVLERRLFDYDLARLAADKGADVTTRAYVYDLIRNDHGEAVGVKALLKEQEAVFHAPIIIGADGVESRVGKWAGIHTVCSIHDMESCAQMTLANVKMDQNCLDFYFGSAVAPGGYLWVFPKGNNKANVGLGISVDTAKKRPVLKYLQEFIARKYPDASILTQIAGGVPCAKTCETIVKNNIMLVGDAAHQVNPVSGGGIISGMIGGMIAGQVAAEAIQKNDFSLLLEYQKRWHKRLGWRNEVFYKIKEAIFDLSDDSFNTIMTSASKLPEEKRTVGGVFRTALWNQPSMLLDVAKVFIS